MPIGSKSRWAFVCFMENFVHKSKLIMLYIRTEQDSCVVAILDERAGIGGRYHDDALAALPICPTTEKIEDVQQFIREQKRPDYFL